MLFNAPEGAPAESARAEERVRGGGAGRNIEELSSLCARCIVISSQMEESRRERSAFGVTSADLT